MGVSKFKYCYVDSIIHINISHEKMMAIVCASYIVSFMRAHAVPHQNLCHDHNYSSRHYSRCYINPESIEVVSYHFDYVFFWF
jgi:hypothetical protein